MSEFVEHMKDELMKLMIELSKASTDLSDTDRRILQERFHVFSNMISREGYMVNINLINPRERNVPKGEEDVKH